MAYQRCCGARVARTTARPSLSLREASCQAYKERRFDSIIPEVISDIDSDSEYQNMITRLKERGQAALTRDENASRQAVLHELDIKPWQQKMKVRLSHNTLC